MDKITAALRRLDLSVPEQTIYLALLRDGRATARVLSARTGITRPSVYDQLKLLISLSLVVELDVSGKAHFAAADIKHLDALLGDKIDRLEQSRASLAATLPSLIGSLDTVTPKLRFFEGSEGVKQLLKDIMWHDHTTLQIIWPESSMAQVFDVAFLGWFDERRSKRTLSVHVLVPGTKKTDMVRSIFKERTDTVSYLPKRMAPVMATIIYNAKVAFISSSREAFGFIVESTEFATQERLKFAALAQVGISKK